MTEGAAAISVICFEHRKSRSATPRGGVFEARRDLLPDRRLAFIRNKSKSNRKSPRLLGGGGGRVKTHDFDCIRTCGALTQGFFFRGSDNYRVPRDRTVEKPIPFNPDDQGAPSLSLFIFGRLPMRPAGRGAFESLRGLIAGPVAPQRKLFREFPRNFFQLTRVESAGPGRSHSSTLCTGRSIVLRPHVRAFRKFAA